MRKMKNKLILLNLMVNQLCKIVLNMIKFKITTLKGKKISRKRSLIYTFLIIFSSAWKAFSMSFRLIFRYPNAVLRSFSKGTGIRRQNSLTLSEASPSERAARLFEEGLQEMELAAPPLPPLVIFSHETEYR